MRIKTKNIFYDMEMTIPKSLGDLTLKQYLEFTKTAEQIKDDGSVESTLLTYKLIEIVTGASEEAIDALKIDDINILSNELKTIIDGFTGFEGESKSFNIDGIDYASTDIDNLDNGEYISLNILKEKYENDYFSMFPMLLAVLVRPAKLEIDQETKKEKWIVERFNRRDMDNLEWRSDLFLHRAKAGDVIPIINFFLNLKNELA